MIELCGVLELASEMQILINKILDVVRENAKHLSLNLPRFGCSANQCDPGAHAFTL